MADPGEFPKTAVRSALRAAWTMSPSYQAYKRSKRIETPQMKLDGTPKKWPKVEYKCNECGNISRESESAGKTVTGKPKRRLLIYIDHVDPVVDPKEGFIDWYHYWDRLYVPIGEWATRLQVLCRYCHKTKTKLEMDERKAAGSLKRGKPSS